MIMTGKMLEKLQTKYTFIPCETEDFKEFSLAGMDFKVSGWDAEGLGRVSLMDAVGMGGQMTMSSLIVNPILVDAPLFNLDIIGVPGQRMLYMELYDTLLSGERDEADYAAVKDAWPSLPDIPGKPAWYDDIRYTSSVTKAAPAAMSDDMDKLIEQFCDVYLARLADAPLCSPAAKKEKADAYRDGLLNNGGPATDSFLKVWGKEKTEQLFKEILFG